MVGLFFLAFIFLGDVTSFIVNPRVSRRFVLPSNDQASPKASCMLCKPNTTFSQFLWDETKDIREKALTTTIVSGVKSGVLDPVTFGVYVMQDAVWCDRTGDSIHLAAQKVQYNHGVHLQSFLLQKSNDYHRYANELYNEWQITDPSAIKESGGCQTYHEYENFVAQTMNVSNFLACMIPCEKLWPWLGSQLMADNTQSFGAYNDWVQNNLDPTYDHYRLLDDFVDELHAKGEVDEREALEVYRNCMTAEVDFFNDPK